MSAEFIDDFEGIENEETFFTPAEKSLLVYSCIIGITTKAVSSGRVNIQFRKIQSTLFCARYAQLHSLA